MNKVEEILNEYYNNYDEEYKLYLDYHLKNCERNDLIGYMY